MTITLTKKYRLIYSPPSPNPGSIIRNCDWRSEQTGKTRFSDAFYNYYQSDNLADVEAVVSQLGLVEAEYCAQWASMTSSERSAALAAH